MDGLEEAQGARVNSQVLQLQLPGLQGVHSTTEEPVGPSAKVKKKKKQRKRPVDSLHLHRGATSQDRLGQRPRLRPLYEYINLDMPELTQPKAEDEVPAQPNQVLGGPVTVAPAPQMEDSWVSSTLEVPAPGQSGNSVEVDIDKMLRYAAHLVPALFPQYK
ncbi:uncharacterized protein C16orf86 homolog [Heliangelus exortis]|uniref:uncharacterized protein C16orf86 homolog n=1 Tax=Heliangelus exortis TaxID=472823 RepID=UPI003A8DD6E5